MDSSTLSELLDEYGELERALSDPTVHAHQDQARKLGRRYAELTPVVKALNAGSSTTSKS